MLAGGVAVVGLQELRDHLAVVIGYIAVDQIAQPREKIAGELHLPIGLGLQIGQQFLRALHGECLNQILHGRRHFRVVGRQKGAAVTEQELCELLRNIIRTLQSVQEGCVIALKINDLSRQLRQVAFASGRNLTSGHLRTTDLTGTADLAGAPTGSYAGSYIRSRHLR